MSARSQLALAFAAGFIAAACAVAIAAAAALPSGEWVERAFTVSMRPGDDAFVCRLSINYAQRSWAFSC